MFTGWKLVCKQIKTITDVVGIGLVATEYSLVV